jgi:hypothetical protein
MTMKYFSNDLPMYYAEIGKPVFITLPIVCADQAKNIKAAIERDRDVAAAGNLLGQFVRATRSAQEDLSVEFSCGDVGYIAYVSEHMDQDDLYGFVVRFLGGHCSTLFIDEFEIYNNGE